MKYYFDLDNTLVNTRNLKKYMTTREGRDFLIANPNAVSTSIVNPRLVDVIKNLNDVAIVTNSPEKYAEAMLKKHGFPEIEIIGSAGKPCSQVYLDNPAIFIGDEPIDILFAHERKMPSIAYTESSAFPEDNINRSLPTAVAKNVKQLESILSETLVYEAPNFNNFISLENLPLEDIPIHHLREYYKWGNPKFKESRSKEVLTFKKTKAYLWSEIVGGARDSFFYQGSIKNDMLFKLVINKIYQELLGKIESLKLQGPTRVIGLPNSLPEFAYLSDPNYVLAYSANHQSAGRNMYRIKPVKEAHSTGARRARKNIGTLGLLKGQVPDLSIANVILVDDVITTGNQFRSAATLLRQAGYSNNIVGIAIAKNIHQEEIFV